MAKCACCGTTVFFGKRSGNDRYCNDDCAAAGPVSNVAKTIPEAQIAAEADRIHRAPCPECRGSGPVDLHSAHTILSFILMTQWRSKSTVSCKRCALKKQGLAFLVSALGGWWGFPWGIIGTPITLLRNIIAMCEKTGGRGPSSDLRSAVRTMLAQDRIATERMTQSSDMVAAFEDARRLSH